MIFHFGLAILKWIWDLSPNGRKEKQLIKRLQDFTDEIIRKRINEFRLYDKDEIEEINSQYAAGKVKRKLALLE